MEQLIIHGQGNVIGVKVMGSGQRSRRAYANLVLNDWPWEEKSPPKAGAAIVPVKTYCRV